MAASKQSLSGQNRHLLRICLSRLRYDLRSFAGNYPGLFLPAVRQMRKDRSRVVDASTELVIEGFPRSGNTFAQAAFHFAQRRPVRTAHHLHAPAQVIEATRLRVPVLVIVRPPKDAVVAWKLTHPQLGLRQLLRSYVRYHQAILPYLDKCVIATFDQVTSDLGAVIDRINKKYGTDFDRFAHTEKDVADVLGVLKDIAYTRMPDRQFVRNMPERSPQREAQKTLLREELQRSNSQRSIALANQLYQSFVSRAIS